MNYKSFTNKNKMQNAELDNQIQANNISLQKWVATYISNRVKNTQPRNQNMSSIIQWDSDWETMESVMSGTIVLAIYKSWNISLGDINQDWISKFSIDMVFRNGINGDGDSTGFQVSPSLYFKKFIGWDIKDLVSNPTSNVKTIKLVASLFTYTPGTLPIFQAKLLVKYLDMTNRD